MLVGFMMFAASSGVFENVSSGFLGAVVSPFQTASSFLSGQAGAFIDRFARAGEIEKENRELKEQNAELMNQMVEYHDLLEQNEQLKKMLEIKELHSDFDPEIASVISRDPNEMFGSFTINKGNLHGIKNNDPVITAAGLVGKVIDVGLISAKVVPITSPELKVSCYEVRDRSVGVLTGDASLYRQGLSKMEHLDREVDISKGNIIVTAGISGIFPQGLVIGTVEEVKIENHGMSAYAIIKPAADVNSVKEVVVIKKFLGQGEDSVSP